MGRIHRILVIVLGVCGFLLIRGAVWAHLGIAVAVSVGIANVMWLPLLPGLVDHHPHCAARANQTAKRAGLEYS